ncbi:hypothetical protein [Azospirillum thermophilum]|nr:hypothetical protein [Azospirillum thermophilum]
MDQAMSIRSTFEAVGQQLLSTGQDGSKAVLLYGAQIVNLVNSLGDDQAAVKNLEILADAMHGVDDVAEAFARLRKEQVESVIATTKQAEALSKLNDWLLRKALGDSSSLSPSAKLTVAQGAFGDAVAAARVSGDIAAATAAADALLSASAAVMVKGTAQYAAQEQWIRASISSLGHALGLPGFAAGGDFGGGLRIVGERGPELEWTGPSRIFSADQTRQILAGAAKPEVPAVTVNVDTGAVVRAIGQSTGELRAEIARLRQEVAELRAEQRRASNLSMVA